MPAFLRSLANLTTRMVFRLKLFGSASIIGPEGDLTGRPVQRRRLALLALLALARQHGATRDKLVGYLWPDAETERARHQLSDSVYRINQAVGGAAITADGARLRLNPEVLPSDVAAFLVAIERGEWLSAVDLHDAPFLDGFFLTDATELERWVDAQRERLLRERARALETLADAAERAGAFAEAVKWWRLLAAQDVYSSRIALRLMRALEKKGERAAALQHAHAHTLLLGTDMGLAPDAELVSFAAELRAGTATAAATTGRSAGTPPPEPISIAVLPFANLGTAEVTDFFGDGVAEDVIAHLSKIRALRVISRTSAMQFRSRDRNLREVGAALGAATLVEGSVRRAAERVRIVARLVDVATDQTLWSETYDRHLHDVFAIQTDVALRIAAALQTRLSADERTRIRREPTHNVHAYPLYVQGRHWLSHFTTDAMHRGIDYMQRALELDPHYALAHANIAMAYAVLAESGEIEPDHGYARAAAATEAALALDPDLAEAHCMMGQLRAQRDFDWAGAEQAFRRALELSPSNADTCNLYGRLCSALGRFDEAIALQRVAHELDPLAHRLDLATTLIRAGRHDEAIESARRAVEFDPMHERARATLGWAFLVKGMHAEGLAELEMAHVLAPESTMWLAQLGQAYALAGEPQRARIVLQRLEEMARERYVSPYHFAYVHTGLGEHDIAVDYLDRACRARSGSIYGLASNFLFAALHRQPRFAALLRRMNLHTQFSAAALHQV
jgi:TolB-like protein/Flp pilus assembly protein TadD